MPMTLPAGGIKKRRSLKKRISPAAKMRNSSPLNERIKPYALLTPVLAVFSVFMFYPFLYTLYLSFFEWNMVRPTMTFVGFDNYLAIFSDPSFGKIMGNTLAYIALFMVFAFVAPYIFSFILSFCIRRAKGFYKSAIFLPSVISVVVGTMIFVWLLNPLSGPAATIMRQVGVRIPIWTNTEGLVIIVLTLITTWKIFGYNFIVIMAGIGSVPTEVIEAARMDDIPNWRIFTSIVIPMSSSTGIYVLITTIVTGLQQVFTPINMVTKGGPNDNSTHIIYEVYDQAFGYFRTGTASAYSILMMLLFVILLYVEFRFVEKGVYYENKR